MMSIDPASIPKSLNYSNTIKNIPIPTKLSKREFISEANNSGFGASNSQIFIPISANMGLDTNRSYCEFDLSVSLTATGTGTSTFTLDNSVYSLIDSIQIQNFDGSLLEELNFYDATANSLADANLPIDVRMTAGSFSGFQMPGVANTLEAKANDSATVGSITNTTASTTTTKLRFGIPMSGLMNLSSPVHNGGVLLPLFLVQGIRLVVNLTKNSNPFIYSTTGNTPTVASWEVKNPKFVAVGTEFESSFVQYVKNQILSADPANGSTYISSYTYTNEQRNITGQQNSLQLNVRARSIKSMFIIPRVAGTATQSKMARKYDGFTNLQLSLANQSYPSVPISGEIALWSELNNALGGLADGIINRSNYKSDDNATLLTYGRFIAGVDLETLVTEGMMMSGFDNKTQSIPIEVRFNVNTAEAKTITISSMIDMMIQVDVRNGRFAVSY